MKRLLISFIALFVLFGSLFANQKSGLFIGAEAGATILSTSWSSNFKGTAAINGNQTNAKGFNRSGLNPGF